MIFRQIEIRNLFSYRHALFDLEGADPERNLVLISGRNGYGKTSFLNSVKLLFVGPNPDICRSVQQGVELKPRQYVEGFGEAWMSIINAHARRHGEHQCSATTSSPSNTSVPGCSGGCWLTLGNPQPSESSGATTCGRSDPTSAA